MKKIIAVIILVVSCMIGVAQEKKDKAPPTFTNKPTLTKEGENYKISFAVSVPTDVEVAVLDNKNQVIRHLVAGVLGGENTPPAPLQTGLKQNLIWDGKNDADKKAEGGPFKVRVRLGIKPQFDGFLLDNPVATGKVTAVAIGPKGELYLWHRDNTANENQGSNKLKVIDRDGKYVRTLMPYPADLSFEKAKVLGALDDVDGSLIPRIFNLQQLNTYYEAIGSRRRPMSDYCSPVVDGQGCAYWIVGNGRLAVIDSLGASPYETSLSEPLFKDIPFVSGKPTLCNSSDGKHIYIAGITRNDDEWGKNKMAMSCVWAINKQTRLAEIFVGDPKSPGREKGSLMEPRGLAVAKGLLFVADGVSDRIVIFKEADRSYLGEIKVKNPQSIGVDSSNESLYVCTYSTKGKADLIKLKGFNVSQEVFRMALPDTFEFGAHRISVDSTAQPARIWIPTLRWKTGELYCYEDAGDKFTVKGDLRDLKGPWVAGPRDLTVDRVRNELYVKHHVQGYYRLDAKSGKFLTELDINSSVGNQDAYGSQLVAAPDGNLIALSWGSAGLRRIDHDGKPLNWVGKNTHIIPYCGIMTFMQRYLAVPSADEMFVILPPAYRKDDKEGHGDYSSLNVLGFDGITRRTAIWQLSAGAVPRIDSKGNIYIADMVKPLDKSYPAYFEEKLGGKFTPTGNSIDSQKFGNDPSQMAKYWESSMYGSIIKFPASGGIIWYEKNLPAGVEGQPSAELLAKPKVSYGTHLGYDFKPVDVQGAEWVRFGFSPYAVKRGAGFCMCEGVGFDVDGFGRVFFPNLGQFRIEMVDTNNNWIGTFGKYGNQDSGGTNAKVSKPEIPLAWPTYVAVCDDYAFVNDTVSNRVVKVKLNATVEENCEIK